MTSEQFKAARLSAGLTQPVLAILLNVTERTVRRYEYTKGDRIKPHPTCCNVLQWVNDGLLVDQVRAARVEHAAEGKGDE